MAIDIHNRPLVCTRSLKYSSTGGEVDVVVRVWLPFQDDADDYRCEFEIVGLPDSIREAGMGVDSMQALASALQGVHKYIQPFRDSLAFLGAPYDELEPLVILLQDAGRRRRIQDILDEDEYAIDRRVLLLERMRAAKE